MSRYIGLVAALALMPVIGVVILPLCAVAVGMSAACCGDRCGFKHLLADGALLMLSAVGGFGSCRVNDPLAGAVSRYIGLVAALALMPVIGAVILPLCAVAVGMSGGRILIGGLNLHSITGHGEGGSRLGGVCQGDIALQHDPLVKDLAGLRCVRRNGDLNALHGAGDGGACGNGCRAAGDSNGVILQGGDLGVLAALSRAVNALFMLLAGLIQRRLMIHDPYPGMLGGFGVGGAVRHLAGGAVAAVCAVFVIRPSRELVSLNVVAVACRALLIVIAGIQIQIRLTGVVMLVVDRNGAGVLLIAAGDGDNCRALCLSGHLAGAVNCCHAGIAALPSQAARCVDRLLHGGELIGRIKIQIYLCRGNGNTGKLNDGSLSYGDIKEGSLRKRSVCVAAILDGNQFQLGFLRSGMSRFRLDLAVLQLNILILRHIRSAVGSSLENAPFQTPPQMRRSQ